MGSRGVGPAQHTPCLEPYDAAASTLQVQGRLSIFNSRALAGYAEFMNKPGWEGQSDADDMLAAEKEALGVPQIAASGSRHPTMGRV